MTVQSSGNPGGYKLAGSSNLPDKSRIAVAAIRYLRPANQQSLTLNSNLTYSVIAYQDAEVNEGKWQTTLNLWEVAPNGQFKEAWQLEDSKLKLSLEPVKEVTFIATVPNSGQIPELQKQLERQINKLADSFIKYTSDGERFIHVSQILPIELPTGKTTPPQPKPEDFNFGWGDRYLIKPESRNEIELKVEPEKRRRTSAPISPAEFMR